MPTAQTRNTPPDQPAANAQSIWQQIRTQLESARQRIIDQISNYPAPRPACDADFNHLLEERARISDELNHLHTAASSASANAREQIESFIATSNYLDDECKRQLLSEL